MDERIASFTLIAAYLLLFMAMTTVAAKAAGTNVWLFSNASGSEKLAAIGFRAAFALAAVAPLVLWAAPDFALRDPAAEFSNPILSAVGIFVSAVGAMIAFAAQVSMGASWRVGVKSGALGALISGGLYDYSRNPTFCGQALLLIGTAAAAPSIATFLAAVLFVWSASTQIRSEEKVLLQTYGNAYADYCRRVPRWLGTPKELTS